MAHGRIQVLAAVLVAVLPGCSGEAPVPTPTPHQRIPLVLRDPRQVAALIGVPYRFTLHLGCGREGEVLFDGSYWEYVAGEVRPGAIRGDRIRGTMRLVRWGLAAFRDRRGGLVTFGRRTFPVPRLCTLGGRRAS